VHGVHFGPWVADTTQDLNYFCMAAMSKLPGMYRIDHCEERPTPRRKSNDLTRTQRRLDIERSRSTDILNKLIIRLTAIDNDRVVEFKCLLKRLFEVRIRSMRIGHDYANKMLRLSTLEKA